MRQRDWAVDYLSAFRIAGFAVFARLWTLTAVEY